MLTIPTCMKEILRRQNSQLFLAKFLLLYVSACYCQTALVDESGMIRNQMVTHNRSEVVAVLGTPCEMPPRKSKSESNCDITQSRYN
jgi:hypothetical protein